MSLVCNTGSKLFTDADFCILSRPFLGTHHRPHSTPKYCRNTIGFKCCQKCFRCTVYCLSFQLEGNSCQIMKFWSTDQCAIYFIAASSIIFCVFGLLDLFSSRNDPELKKQQLPKNSVSSQTDGKMEGFSGSILWNQYSLANGLLSATTVGAGVNLAKNGDIRYSHTSL